MAWDRPERTSTAQNEKAIEKRTTANLKKTILNFQKHPKLRSDTFPVYKRMPAVSPTPKKLADSEKCGL